MPERGGNEKLRSSDSSRKKAPSPIKPCGPQLRCVQFMSTSVAMSCRNLVVALDYNENGLRKQKVDRTRKSIGTRKRELNQATLVPVSEEKNQSEFCEPKCNFVNWNILCLFHVLYVCTCCRYSVLAVSVEGQDVVIFCILYIKLWYMHSHYVIQYIAKWSIGNLCRLPSQVMS